jgi:hypothetical protein
MSTEYEIVEGEDSECILFVTTHGGKLDLDFCSPDDPACTTIASLDPKELAEIGIKLLRVAMFNDYNSEDCGLDIEGFKKWAHKQVDDL